MNIRKYIRRLYWYSLTFEYGSYLFVISIFVITAVILFRWSIYSEEARSVSKLLLLPIPFILLYGFLLRMARKNLLNWKWRWILFALLIPPCLVSVLGILALADLFYINLKLSRRSTEGDNGSPEKRPETTANFLQN